MNSRPVSQAVKSLRVSCLPILAVLALTSSPQQAEAQILAFNFDEAGGTTATNAGSAGTSANLTLRNATGTATDYHSATSAGGINGPGGVGDQSLNLTSSTGMGNAGGAWTGPYASSTTAGSAFNSAVSFTITGWYNASIAPGGGARLLQSSNFILFINSGVIVLQTSATDSILSNGTVAGSGPTLVSSSGSPITTPSSQWVFFGITYDGTGTNKSVTFYQGDSSASSSLTSRNVLYTTTSLSLGNGAGLSLGSNVTSGSNVRPFDGSFDDFQVYSSTTNSSGALSAATLNSLRLAAIPEPSIRLILAAGMALLATPRRRH